MPTGSLATSYFYAIRIYHFRYTTLNEDLHTRPKVVKRALKSLLNIAQRIFSKNDEELYERLHYWPLFIAGVETSDPIHREWILERFSSGKFKTVLEKVVKVQRLSGTRVHMSLIQEMCSQEGDAPRVTFLGFWYDQVLGVYGFACFVDILRLLFHIDQPGIEFLNRLGWC